MLGVHVQAIKQNFKARIRTDAESKVIFKTTGEHKHDNSERKLEANQL